MSECPLKVKKKELIEKKKKRTTNVNQTDSCIPYQFENLFVDIQVPNGFLPRRKTLIQHLKPKKQQTIQFAPQTKRTQDISLVGSYKKSENQRANIPSKKTVYHSLTRPQTGIHPLRTY